MFQDHMPTGREPSDALSDADRRDELEGGGSGEDEGSAAKEGDEDHLHEDQKTTSR